MPSLNSLPKLPRDRVCYAHLTDEKTKAQVHRTLDEETQAWDTGRQTPEPRAVLGASSETPLQVRRAPSRCRCSEPCPISGPSKGLRPAAATATSEHLPLPADQWQDEARRWISALRSLTPFAKRRKLPLRSCPEHNRVSFSSCRCRLLPLRPEEYHS